MSLEEQFEAVAGLHLALEVDIVGEDADQFAEQAVAQARIDAGIVEAVLDLAGDARAVDTWPGREARRSTRRRGTR